MATVRDKGNPGQPIDPHIPDDSEREQDLLQLILDKP